MASRFVGGGGLPVSSGLVAWYAADQISGLSNGDPVVKWLDGSGNGNHASQNTQAAQPTYQTNQINGHAAVNFDGVDDYMSFLLAGFPTGNQPRAGWFVVKYTICKWGGLAFGTPLAGEAWGPSANSTNKFECIGYGAADLVSGVDATLAGWTILSAVFDGTTTTLYQNGTQIAQGARTYNTVLASGLLGKDLGSSNLSAMLMASGAIYNQSLSATARSALDRYFGSYYNIAVSD